mmetsp:Transcript_22707/g.63362  ORF Transcript_22707/g.63362 Transcript_22707/m.63362 type:complete len:251 (-) Transcript_22707:117-869(-)
MCCVDRPGRHAYPRCAQHLIIRCRFGGVLLKVLDQGALPADYGIPQQSLLSPVHAIPCTMLGDMMCHCPVRQFRRAPATIYIRDPVIDPPIVKFDRIVITEDIQMASMDHIVRQNSHLPFLAGGTDHTDVRGTVAHESIDTLRSPVLSCEFGIIVDAHDVVGAMLVCGSAHFVQWDAMFFGFGDADEVECERRRIIDLPTMLIVFPESIAHIECDEELEVKLLAIRLSDSFLQGWEEELVQCGFVDTLPV